MIPCFNRPSLFPRSLVGQCILELHSNNISLVTAGALMVVSRGRSNFRDVISVKSVLSTHIVAMLSHFQFDI